MKIQLHEIIARDLFAGCHDDGVGGNNCQMLCRKCNREKSAK